MSLLLWGCTFGHSETRLQAHQADFVRWFRANVTAFPVVQERLTTYLLSSDADIWLITGSPQSLVEQVYFDTPWLPRVNLIASQMARRYGGWVLTVRCLGHEKVAQLERKIGTPLRLYSGYSDSKQDNPLLLFLPASLAGDAARRVAAARIVKRIASVYNAARFHYRSYLFV